MARRFYSKRHYDRLNNGGADAPGAADERRRRRAAGEQANREMVARFSPLAPSKICEALAWQEARIRELMGDDATPAGTGR